MNRNDYGGLKHSKQYYVWMTQNSNITLMDGACLGQDYLLSKARKSQISPISQKGDYLNCDMERQHMKKCV